ncbi:MAG: hypothetical protein [Betabaculovirus sp.]|nr:MAG: hypothetical protein [Betabaculovirus sp.]
MCLLAIMSSAIIHIKCILSQITVKVNTKFFGNISSKLYCVNCCEYISLKAVISMSERNSPAHCTNILIDTLLFSLPLLYTNKQANSYKYITSFCMTCLNSDDGATRVMSNKRYMNNRKLCLYLATVCVSTNIFLNKT